MMHPEGSVGSWEFVRVRLHRLSAVPALLVCYAVVFNLGPFAKAPQRQAAPQIAEQSIAATPVAQPEAGPNDRLEYPHSSTVTMVRAESITPVADTVAPTADTVTSADDTLVRISSQPLDLTPANAPAAAIPAADTVMPDAPAQQAAIEGIWAPNARSCSLRDLRDGSLAAIIDMEGARAGDTYCAFKKQKKTPTGWRVVATCSNELEHWTADVRLTIKDDHLTWASGRGSQIYTRCAPDALRTAAR
jgi:hypothetical protein